MPDATPNGPAPEDAAAIDHHPSDARPLTLETRAVSPEGQALVNAVWAMVEPVILGSRKTKPGAATTEKNRLAVEAIIAGVLLNEARYGRGAWSWQRLAAFHFKGQAVTKRHFDGAFSALRGDLGMVGTLGAHTRFHAGADEGGWADRKATRLRATERLHGLAEAHDVSDGRAHFERQMPTTPPEPVILNAPGRWIKGKRLRGEPLPLPTAGDGARRVAYARRTVEEANGFIRGFTITGCDPILFQRKFTGDMWGHGRWYASYSTMPKEDRKAIRIDGEEVAEADVHASFLWATFPRADYWLSEDILEGRAGRRDLYTFGGLERAAAKAWITATFGKGTPLKRWSKLHLTETPSLREVDCARVGDAALARYPFLADLPRIWGCPDNPRSVSLRVMNDEAEALTAAMEGLSLYPAASSAPLWDSCESLPDSGEGGIIVASHPMGSYGLHASHKTDTQRPTDGEKYRLISMS